LGKKKEKDELDYEPVTAKDDLKLKRRGKPVDVVSHAPESRRMVYLGLRLDRDALKRQSCDQLREVGRRA